MTVGSAYWIAAVRARESERDDPLFVDPYARALAGAQGFAIMAASERATGGENAFIPVRVRWFDDLVVRAASGGVRQIVLLGAGFDTRAYRLDLAAELDWYELDRAEVFADKELGLGGVIPRCRRHTVVGDLAGDWGASLLDAGLDVRERTLWLAEGLFFYLTEETIVAVLRAAAGLCAGGSLFAADVIGAVGLDGPAMRSYHQWRAANGVPPPYGADDPTALLAAGGWELDHVTAPGAADANYGRLPVRAGGQVAGRTHLVTGRLPG